MKKEKAFILIAFACVVTCGVIGLMTSEGYDIFNSLFFTIIMFLGNYSDPTSSILINIARYGAITLTATTVLLLLKNIFNYIKDYSIAKKKDSIFLFGNNEYTQDFLKSSSGKVINREEIMDTDKYVLLDDENVNIEFYNKNKERLKNKSVYIKSETFSNQILNEGKVHYFSLEQLAAKKYWEKNLLLPLAKENDKFKKELNVVFVGFNSFAEEVLYQSLMVNIFNAKQKVNYHIFTDKTEQIEQYRNYAKLNIKYYNTSFLNHFDIVDSADKILFFNELQSLIKCFGLLHKGNITYFTNTDIHDELLTNHRYGKNDSIVLDVYNYTENICNQETIINEKEIEDAKKLNAAYSKEMGVTTDAETLWCELSTFHKYSNISGVDFFKNTVEKILEAETGKLYKEIQDDEFNKHVKMLGELEHMRWVNYHLFCNWEYNEITNKKNKQHNCLVPFNKLPKSEKTKDENQIKFLRDILKNDGR